MRRFSQVWVFIVALGLSAHADEITWNVQDKYGITAEGIEKAIQDAHAHFKNRPNDQVVLEFDEGSYELKDESESRGTINLSGIRPGPEGRLVFKGQGMDRTTLVFSDNKHAIFGRDVYRVTFIGMHMTRARYTVSQGTVVEVAEGSVVLDIQEGFPTPEDIFDPQSDQGRYLRRYTDSRTEPQIIEQDNEQVPWKSAMHVGGQRWRIEMKRRSQTPDYAVGDLVGIKSKHGGQTYWLMGGSDFTFEGVKWTHKTRGVFRGGFNNVHIIDCVTERAAPIEGQTPYLAAPGGGPQIGQPNDPPSSGHLVKGCRFVGSGDDAVAFFNSSGEISGCYITDAFCRGILLANSPDVVLMDNRLIRNPLQQSKDHIFPRNQNVPGSD